MGFSFPFSSFQQTRMRVVSFYLLFSLLPLLGLTDAGQEAVQLVNLHESNPVTLQYLSQTRSPLPIAVPVSLADLPVVSFSVLAAESWLKTHVLAYFPSTRVTTIVVGKGILCNKDHEQQWSLVLPSVRNVYYSLVRWGLVKEIKVSVAFSSDCLHPPTSSSRFRGDLVENILKPILSFLQDSNSSYSIELPPHFSHLSQTANWVLSTHKAVLQRLGFSQLKDIRLMLEEKPMNRKLSSMSFPSFPERPKPVGFPAPAHSAGNPNPPSFQFSPAPDASFSFVPNASPNVIPANPPDVIPASPPDAFVVPPPPCSAAVVPSPGTGEEPKGELWCVAKPTVPAETLQEAMDYACGEGGADCEEIRPRGSCYNPDTVVAHASYAFNSYWQNTKQTGGSCSFGGTAMLITSDPSFLQCRFVLS